MQVDVEAPGTVVATVDVERGGRWISVVATIGDPEPEIGFSRPHVLAVSAVDQDGVIVALTTDEVVSLRDEFERAYYRWRGRGVYQGG